MPKASPQGNIFAAFIFWHLCEAPKAITTIWKNYLFFYWEYFSIPILLKTLFNHWRKLVNSYGRGFDIKRFFSTLAENLISRFLGFLVRAVTIIIGLLFELAVLAGGFLLLVAWYLWPLIFILGNLIGLYLII
ncbi:MAG: hypothetical protein PHN39_01070 [Candidatus Pacebacteria bacterium]|nr:hypothetical protein [Candidatus Paceibacterota bacterium]